jgi:hypothetical protein
VRDDFTEFVGTSHPMERLHIIERSGELFVSNSLAFVLAETEDELDPTYRFYDRDLISFVDGLDALTDHIPTASGARVRLVYCRNVRVRKDLSLTLVNKPLPPHFKTFAEYVEYVRSQVVELHANATAPSRRVTFSSLATISSGYDSAAAAIFAKAIGCAEALTFRDARENFGSASDSGLEIGRILGFSVHELERTDYLRKGGFPEAEFLAVGTGGEDVVMSAFEDYVAGKLLFTGFLGDTLWSRLHPDPKASERFKMVSPAGASIAEFRLRVGFVHVAIPLLTFTRHPDLHRISNSAEMRQWRTGGRYDRPIPRRLIEEHGVPRPMFGVRKRAVTQPFYFNESLSAIMSPAGYADFTDFLRRLAGKGHNVRLYRGMDEQLLYLVLPAFHRINYMISRVLVEIAGRLDFALPMWLLVPPRFRQRLATNVFTVQWGSSQVRERYCEVAPRGRTPTVRRVSAEAGEPQQSDSKVASS